MKILITAGTTHEHIDPVRFISNASSGLQGVLIAHEAIELGHEVVLIVGPCSLPELEELESRCNCDHCRLHTIHVTSAEDMYNAAMKHFSECDVAICSAAVGDYRVKEISADKIKRTGDSIILELIPNKDIAKALGEIKTDTQKLVGFALETSNGVENAKAKITKKNFDFIVLNETNEENQAFGSHYNVVSLITKEGEIKSFPRMLKHDIAKEILKKLCQ